MKSKIVELKFQGFEDIKKVLKANIPVFFIIATLIFIAFIAGISGEFVSDDIPGITKNINVIDFGKSIQQGQIQPIIYSAIYNIFGENEEPFHAFSMLFHFVNIILFFLIIYNLFDKKVAALASVLYAVHPVVAETVYWISALNYLINTFILQITVLLYMLYKTTGKKSYIYIFTGYMLVLPFIFGNYWLYMIPFFLLALELFFFFDQKINWKPILLLVPLFLISLVSFLLKSQTQLVERVGSLQTPDATPYFNRVPYTIYMTWELLFYPADLTIYHEGRVIGQTKYVMMFVISLATIALILFLLKKEKLRIYGGLILLMFVASLPVFSPIQVAWFIAERYMYVTTGMFAALVAVILLKTETRFKKKNFALIVCSLLVIAYIGRDIVRAQDWKTRKNLWLSTELHGPYSARVHNNLGDVFGIEKNYAESIRHFELAIAIKPTYSEAMHNLGNTYLQIGNYDKAKEVLSKSLEVNPMLFQSIHKLGLIEYNKGNVEQAKEYFRKTLEIDPTYLPAIEALQILQQRTQ